MTAPDWWETILLAFAAYRTWRMLALDDVLERLRDRLLHGRPRLDAFVSCAWCAGFWIALSWWAAWELAEETLIAATPFAISAAVGIVASALRESD